MALNFIWYISVVLKFLSSIAVALNFKFSISVALNYQTAGLMMDLYNGFFLKNGACGYVLKPAIMREEIAYFSANTKDVIPGVSPQILHIKVGL